MKKREIKTKKKSGVLEDKGVKLKKIGIITAISFLLGLAEAFFVYIMPGYFKNISGMENIGIFYFISYVVVLVLILNLHKLVRKFGKSDVFFFFLFLRIISILFLIFNSSEWLGIFYVMSYIVLGNIVWIMLDMILEAYSKDSLTGRIRGKFLTVMNVGFILSPFFSTLVLEKYDYYMIFLILFVLNSGILLISALSLSNVNHRFEKKLELMNIFKKVIKREDIRKISYISFAMEFFYALMIIYVPIYLISIGMSWREMGIIFTIMLIPFVVVQYPAGYLADRKIGEKEMLIGSIILMSFFTFILYFISSKNILIWSTVLLFARTGVALIEILRDSYFYKRIDVYDIDLISMFRVVRPIAYILATIISIFVVSIFSVKAIFILVALVSFSALYPAIFLVDNKSERELKNA